MSAVVLVAGVLGVAGAGVGRWTALELATGGYRIEEDEASGPAGSTWWPPVALGLAWFGVSATIGALAHWAALPAYLLFCWLGVALVWIDLDVHRLPNGLVLPSYPAVGVLLAIASVADGGGRWRTALTCGVALWLLFWLIAWLPGGGLGQGDVKLAGIMGAVLGWLSPSHLVLGVMFTFLLGGIAAIVLLVLGRAGRKTRIAFGPAMCLGTLLALLLAPRIIIGMTVLQGG